MEKLWSEFNFVNKLRNAGQLKDIQCEVCSDTFDVFSLSHLKVAFIVLGFGFVVSATVFLAEIFWKWCSSTETPTESVSIIYVGIQTPRAFSAHLHYECPQLRQMRVVNYT